MTTRLAAAAVIDHFNFLATLQALLDIYSCLQLPCRLASICGTPSRTYELFHMHAHFGATLFRCLLFHQEMIIGGYSSKHEPIRNSSLEKWVDFTRGLGVGGSGGSRGHQSGNKNISFSQVKPLDSITQSLSAPSNLPQKASHDYSK